MALSRLADFGVNPTAAHDPRELQLVERCAEYVDRFDAVHMGRIVCLIASTMVRVPIPQILQRLVELQSQQSRLSTLSDELLASLATALPRSALGKEASRVLLGIAMACAGRLRSFEINSIARLCVALAKTMTQVSEFLVEVVDLLPDRIGEFSSSHVADLIWSLAKLKVDGAKRMLENDAVVGVVIAHLQEFESVVVAELLWSYATLGVPCQDVLAGLWQRASVLQACPQAFPETTKKHMQLYFAKAVCEEMCPGSLNGITSELERHLTDDVATSVASLSDLTSIRELDAFLRNMESADAR